MAWGGSPITGKDRNQNIYSYIQNGLQNPQAGPRAERSDRLTRLYDTTLADPTGTAKKFQGLYGDAAAAYNAPLLRKFQDTIGGVAGNVAARFGGNASSEEERQVRATADDFSRNATEANARMGGQAVTASQAYTAETGAAANQAQQRQDDLSRMILAGLTGLDPAKEKKSVLGGLIGTGLSIAKAASGLDVGM